MFGSDKQQTLFFLKSLYCTNKVVLSQIAQTLPFNLIRTEMKSTTIDFRHFFIEPIFTRLVWKEFKNKNSYLFWSILLYMCIALDVYYIVNVSGVPYENIMFKNVKNCISKNIILNFIFAIQKGLFYFKIKTFCWFSMGHNHDNLMFSALKSL